MKCISVVYLLLDIYVMHIVFTSNFSLAFISSVNIKIITDVYMLKGDFFIGLNSYSGIVTLCVLLVVLNDGEE